MPENIGESEDVMQRNRCVQRRGNLHVSEFVPSCRYLFVFVRGDTHFIIRDDRSCPRDPLLLWVLAQFPRFTLT